MRAWILSKPSFQMSWNVVREAGRSVRLPLAFCRRSRKEVSQEVALVRGQSTQPPAPAK